MRRLLVLAVLVALAAAGVVAGWRWLASVVSPAPLTWLERSAHPLTHAGQINASARRNGLDPALVAAVIKVESGFDPQARSPQGALGLMQLLPETAAHIARQTGGVSFTTEDLRDPAINIRYGCYYLGIALRAFQGDQLAAVAAYNAGIGAVMPWVAQARAEGRRLALRDIAYAETRAYVSQVLSARATYRELHGERLGPAP